MDRIRLLILQCLLIGASYGEELDFNFTKFPDDFLFGVSTSSYQIEGGWNEGGRGESIWDSIIHKEPLQVYDKCNADEACKSYYLHKRDVEMLRELGVNFYRFSLSWPRIMPNGRADSINEIGLKYYNDLIDELIKSNIEPMVTMYHWDLPQAIQDKGGFLNKEFPYIFEDYARVLFETFGDRVKYWNTFNEPSEICIHGYGAKLRAPQVNYHGYGEYTCNAYLLEAHARAYHLYNTTYRHLQQGKIGISLSGQWAEPITDSDQNKIKADEVMQFYLGMYIHPICSKTGSYPPVVEARVPKERLVYPPGSCDVHNTIDFIGLNHYDVFYTMDDDKKFMKALPSFDNDMGLNILYVKRWTKKWIEIGPGGIGKALKWIQTNCNDPLMFVTETGIPTGPGLNDFHRVWYLRRYLAEILKAMEDGVRVQGFSFWSLMDNFEWFNGYTDRFGLYEVDFKDANRTRTPRRSAAIYKNIIKSRIIDPDLMNDKEWDVGEEQQNLCRTDFQPKFDRSHSMKRVLKEHSSNKSNIQYVIDALNSQVLSYREQQFDIDQNH